MSGTNKKIGKYLGYKFYKENDDHKTYNIIRIIRVLPFNDKVMIMNIETGETRSVNIESLKGYTPLEPFGQIAFSHVLIYGEHKAHPQHDVMVMIYRGLDLKLGDYEPFAICRQSITDFFYNLVSNNEMHDIVGTCVNKQNCPPNIDYKLIAGCDEVVKSEIVNYYLEDTVDTILKCIATKEYDNILTQLFNDHIESKGLFLAKNNDSVDGWCKKLSTLLKENNFITDLDQIRDIVAVDFNLSDYMIDNNDKTFSLNPDCLRFFNDTFKVNAVDTIGIKYDADIDLAEFNNKFYVKIRDNQNNLYIIVYKVSGEYIEKDLQSESEKQDVSTKLRLAFYDKYSK